MSDETSFRPYRPKRRPNPGNFFVHHWKPLSAATAFLVYAFIFVLGENGLWDNHRLNQLYEEQAEQIARLESQKQELQNYLSALENRDEAAMERAARDIGLVGPGERVYKIEVAEPQQSGSQK